MPHSPTQCHYCCYRPAHMDRAVPLDCRGVQVSSEERCRRGGTHGACTIRHEHPHLQACEGLREYSAGSARHAYDRAGHLPRAVVWRTDRYVKHRVTPSFFCRAVTCMHCLLCSSVDRIVQLPANSRHPHVTMVELYSTGINNQQFIMKSSSWRERGSSIHNGRI